MTHRKPTVSLELRFLIDRAFAARQSGQPGVAEVFDHAAERLVATVVPAFADRIAKVSSRKGEGRQIALEILPLLTPALAAAVNIVWTLRGARQPAIRTLNDAFQDDPTFNETIKLLCARILPPTSLYPDATTTDAPITPPMVVEVAAPAGR